MAAGTRRRSRQTRRPIRNSGGPPKPIPTTPLIQKVLKIVQTASPKEEAGLLNKTLLWVFITLLLSIHTLDMELTAYYVGNEYVNESFPPMRWAIGQISLYPALWLSRIIVYFYIWLTLINQNKKRWWYAIVLVTILYWTAMISWLFQLGIVEWPLPKSLLTY